jgi:hypothetical protein
MTTATAKRPRAEESEAPEPIPPATAPTSGPAWKLEFDCSMLTPRPTTGWIEAKLNLSTHNASFAWAFGQEKTRHYQESRECFDRIREDFKKSPAFNECAKFEKTIAEARERAEADREEIAKLQVELSQTIMAGKEPFALRRKIDGCREKLANLQTWCAELEANLTRAIIKAEVELAELHRDEVTRLVSEFAEKETQLLNDLAAVLGPKVLELEKIRSAMFGLTLDRILARYGSLKT